MTLTALEPFTPSGKDFHNPAVQENLMWKHLQAGTSPDSFQRR